MRDAARTHPQRVERPPAEAQVEHCQRVAHQGNVCRGSTPVSTIVSKSVSHSVGAHTVALQPATDSNDDDYYDDEQSTASTATTSTAPDPAAAAPDEPADCCEVCRVAPREGFALVPCGHARFCENCATDIMRHLAVSNA